MSEIQLVHFSFRGDGPAHEKVRPVMSPATAKAADVRDPARAVASRLPLAERLRLAVAGRSMRAADTCGCPA